MHVEAEMSVACQALYTSTRPIFMAVHHLPREEICTYHLLAWSFSPCRGNGSVEPTTTVCIFPLTYPEDDTSPHKTGGKLIGTNSRALFESKVAQLEVNTKFLVGILIQK